GKPTPDNSDEIEVARAWVEPAEERRSKDVGTEHRRAVRLDGVDDLRDEGLQLRLGHGHCPKATRPAATVSRTWPLSRLPSSHELAERERKAPSSTCHSAAVSSRTRFAGAPTAIRGRSSPYACAGPADIRSSSVSSGTRPGSTRLV